MSHLQQIQYNFGISFILIVSLILIDSYRVYVQKKKSNNYNITVLYLLSFTAITIFNYSLIDNYVSYLPVGVVISGYLDSIVNK